MYLTVTQNVIPQSDMARYDKALTKKEQLSKAITLAQQHFQEAEHKMHFLHKKDVEETKVALEELIAACNAYKKNLGW